MKALRRTIGAFSSLALRRLAGKEGIAVSVLIATRNRATYLDLTLAALERQALPGGLWEVLVADDASQDDTADLLERYAASSRMGLRRIRLDRPAGAGAARNAAAAMARGTIVVLLGEDCLTRPDFLGRHVGAQMRAGGVVLGDASGRVVTHLFGAPDATTEVCEPQRVVSPEEMADPSFLERLSWRTGPAGAGLSARRGGGRVQIEHPWALMSARNASLRRQHLVEVGLWDARITTPDVLDADLARRLFVGGCGFSLEPAAAVYRQDAPETPRDPQRVARDAVHVFSRDRAMGEVGRRLVLAGWPEGTGTRG